MKYECAGAWECALPIAMNNQAIRKNKMKNGKNHQGRKERTNNRNGKACGSFYRKYENGLNQAPRKSKV